MSESLEPAEIYSDASSTDTPPSISARRIGQLVVKTWPFLRPMLKHLVVLFGVGVLISIAYAAAGLVAFDVVNNKILVGAKLQPLQASLLLLDESFVDPNATAETEAIDDGDEPGSGADDQPQPQLTADQRKVVRDRVLIAGGILLLLSIPLGFVVPYYFSWVWQSVNQNLRVAMIERAEHLSLQFHSHSRVGDTIFRVYQDSAMINSLLEEGIIGPIQQIYGLALALIFITFFDPRIAVVCLLVGLPMLWLTIRYTPRLRRRSLANRRAYSNLTSRLQESLTAARVVKANRAEHTILTRFDVASQKALDAALAIRLDMAMLSLLVRILGAVLIIGAEYVMVSWVIDDRETFLGIAVISLIGFAVWNLGSYQTARAHVGAFVGGGAGLVRTWSMLQDLFVGLERAFYLLDMEPTIVDPVEPRKVPDPIHAGGLRYHGMAPLVSHLYEEGLVEAEAIGQTECFEGAVKFARTEGIIPAPEPAHAIASAIREAEACKESGEEKGRPSPANILRITPYRTCLPARVYSTFAPRCFAELK